MRLTSDDRTRLEIDLEDAVPRKALLDCLQSGWDCWDIAEEFDLASVDDVIRWCDYHDLPHPQGH